MSLQVIYWGFLCFVILPAVVVWFLMEIMFSIWIVAPRTALNNSVSILSLLVMSVLMIMSNGWMMAIPPAANFIVHVVILTSRFISFNRRLNLAVAMLDARQHV